MVETERTDRSSSRKGATSSADRNRNDTGGECLSTADTLERIAHETWVEIIRALYRPDEIENRPTDGVSFSTLRKRVDVVDSGRFNYHLSVLMPHFVRKGPDGYRLTLRGNQAAAAIRCLTLTEPTGSGGRGCESA